MDFDISDISYLISSIFFLTSPGNFQKVIDNSPLEGRWLTKKMVIYAIVALVMIAVGASLVAVSGPMILVG